MNARLDQCAGVINVVLMNVVAAVETPALRRLAHLRVRVQITIWVFRLRRDNAVDVAVESLLQRRVALRGEIVGTATDHLIEQAIGPRRSIVFLLQPSVANPVEVQPHAILLELCEAIRNRHLAPRLDLRRPKLVVNDHLLNRYRHQLRTTCQRHQQEGGEGEDFAFHFIFPGSGGAAKLMPFHSARIFR